MELLQRLPAATKIDVTRAEQVREELKSRKADILQQKQNKNKNRKTNA